MSELQTSRVVKAVKSDHFSKVYQAFSFNEGVKKTEYGLTKY